MFFRKRGLGGINIPWLVKMASVGQENEVRSFLRRRRRRLREKRHDVLTVLLVIKL